MTKDDKHKSFYVISAIIGLALCLPHISIYRQTVIPLKVPFVLIFFASAITFVLIQKDYRKIYQVTSLFYPVMQSIISFGFITSYLFTAANFYLANNEKELKTFPIVRKYIKGGKNPEPALIINYDGKEKELVLHSSQQYLVDTSNNVVLTVREGWLGYDVFSDIILK